MSDFIKHVPCDVCGSRDNNSLYTDGHTYCFGCDHWIPPTDLNGEDILFNDRENYMDKEVSIKGFRGAIPERNITKEIAVKYGVRISHGENGEINKHYYPYYHAKTGDLLGYKERNTETKSFHIEGTNRGAGLFGQQVFKEGGKYLTICEGELDALSINEMFDGKWAVVSLKNGSGGALRDIKENLDYIESFDNVVLCFDNDDAGNDAVKEVRDVISPNKLCYRQIKLKTS